MVTGVHKAAAKSLIWGRIAWLAARAYRSPGRSLAALRQMVAERTRVRAWKTRKYALVGRRYFWHLYAPGWPSRAFDRYIERELDRVQPFRNAPPALQSAVFAITKRCSYRCEHCCEWRALGTVETLSVDDALAIVGRLRERGASQIFFSGGEPLNRFDDLLRLIDTTATEADVWVLTSGVGLTRAKADALREAGLTGVSLSLDHWDAEAHDRFRGVRGARAWVDRASEGARSADLVVALSLCPTRAFVSRDNLDKYAETAGRLGASFMQILEPKAIGRYHGQDVALTADQRTILEEFCDRLNTAPACDSLPSVSYPDYSNRANGCFGAGDRHLYIDTDGLIHPCPFCRDSVGSALDGDFDGALATMQSRGCRAACGEHAHHG